MHGGAAKPGSIIYGVKDVPPMGSVIPLVMQHVAMCCTIILLEKRLCVKMLKKNYPAF